MLALILLSALSCAAAQVSSGTALQIWPCDSVASAQSQTWTIVSQGPPNDSIKLGGSHGVPDSGLVLNVLGYSNSSGAVLNVWSSVHNNAQQFSYDTASGHIKVEMNGLCAGTANSSGVLPAGSSVVQVACADVATVQWSYNASTGAFVWAKDPTMCLDAGSSVSCAQQPFAGYPYCNSALTVEDRVADLMSRLQPVEAAAMLSASNNGVPRLGVPPLRYGESLHGVVSGCGAPYTSGNYTSTGCPTSFPTGAALGAALNRSLWNAVGDAISLEGRALFNQNYLGNSLFFTPDINTARDGRWGRSCEVASEDPLINGEFGVAYVTGFQATSGGGPAGSGYLRAVAMVKHGAGTYDQEGNNGPHDRTRFCAPVDGGTFVGYHLPPFKATLTRGNAGGMMCAASGYNGLPACAHNEVNNGIFRNTFGWGGAIVTDGNGVGYLYDTYGHGALDCVPVVATGYTDACRVGLRGGVDVELGETLNNYALAAVADGNITWADINTALSRTLPYLFRLGLMDNASAVPWNNLGPADVDTPQHRSLALEAALQAVTLLQNNASAASPNGAGSPLLPLQLDALAAKGAAIAVIGPNADAPQTCLANYHGTNTLVNSHTPLITLQAAAAAAGNGKGVGLRYAAGCSDGAPCTNTSGFADAVTAAQGAAVALVFGGLAPSLGGPQPGALEGEELDRDNTTLPEGQAALLRAITATGTPVVLVLMRGGSVSLQPDLLANPLIAAIVDAPYLGELCGDALTAVLAGAVSPSGRLTVTMYPAGWEAIRGPINEYNMSAGDGITYQYYTGTPQFEFGTGLSYTSFSYSWLTGSAEAAGAPRTVDTDDFIALPPAYGVVVTNTGSVTSDVSVLGMWSTGLPGQPLQELFDFQRAAALAPGQNATLYFTLPADVAAVVTPEGEQALQPGSHTVRIGEPGQWLQATLTLTGQRRVLFSLEEALASART